MSDLETETTSTSETTTFEQLGRSWTVPVKRHHKHLVELKRIIRTEGAVDADDICAVYLPPQEYAELIEFDLDEDALGDFADQIAKALGVGDKGNS